MITSTEKKSAAALAPWCGRRNVFLPRHALAPRACWLEPVAPQDPLDRVAADLVAEVVQRTDQPRVTPGGILRCHPDGELFHVSGHGRTPGPTARRAVGLAGDQLAVPAQDRLGRDQASELAQPATTDDPALDGQASPLVIGERRRRPPSCARRTRFSSRRKSRTSSWRESNQNRLGTGVSSLARRRRRWAKLRRSRSGGPTATRCRP